MMAARSDFKHARIYHWLGCVHATTITKIMSMKMNTVDTTEKSTDLTASTTACDSVSGCGGVVAVPFDAPASAAATPPLASAPALDNQHEAHG